MADHEVMERIFAGDDSQGPMWNPKSGDMEDFYEYQVKMLIEDARTYNLDNRATKREMAMRYYQGLEPYLDEQGRSTIVATEVRDTILQILPSLVRIFTASETAVEFIPNTEAMTDLAAQATDYVNYVFTDDNEGFLILHSVFKDALTKAEGVVTWWTDNTPSFTTKNYTNLTMEQCKYIASQDNTTVLKHEPVKKPKSKGLLNPQDPMAVVSAEPTFDMEVRVDTSKPIHMVEAVPPDEFRIDRYAKGVKGATLVGKETIKTPSELIKLGFDRETVDQYHGQTIASIRWNEERSLRNHGLETGLGGPDVQGGIMYGEYYIRIDKDDDGIAELRKICVMGEADEIVSDEPVDNAKFAYFCPDPEPHTAIGHSIADLVMDLQKIKTNIMRNSLDSIASTIYPRLWAVEGQVNLDDVLNAELGAPIRCRQPNMVGQLASQFIGDAPMAMVQYLDGVKAARTGVTEASKGLDPKSLQSTTVKGVDMVITGAQERVELIARILAETGMKDMFKGLLREVTENPNPGRVVKIRGKWIPVVPDAYDATMGVRVNPSLGRGSDADRFAMLSQIAAKQEMVITTMGPNNPMVSPVEWRNTMEDMLGIAGIKNISRYFKAVTPEQLQQAASAPPPPNPAVMLAQTEQQKAESAVVKQTADNDFRYTKLEMDDKFRRDMMMTNAMLKNSGLHAQYGAAMDGKQMDVQLQQQLAADKHTVDLAKQGLDQEHQREQQESQQSHQQDMQGAEHEQAAGLQLAKQQHDQNMVPAPQPEVK